MAVHKILDSNWALVYGYQGQDGTILCKSLSTQHINYIGVGKSHIKVCKQDSTQKYFLKNFSLLNLLIKSYAPKEVYYLAAYHTSSEGSLKSTLSKSEFAKYYKVNVDEFIWILDLFKKLNINSNIFYASSAHIFGNSPESILKEESPYAPDNFYGMTKVIGMWIAKKYRIESGMNISSGILFNHESHLRKINFLSSKVITTAYKIKNGQKIKLEIGNPDIRIDWGYAADFVRAFQLINRQAKPDDYIISTGTRHTIIEFVKLVFQYLDIPWQEHVVINPSLIKSNVEFGLAVPDKLTKETGWKPSFEFDNFVSRLVEDFSLSR